MRGFLGTEGGATLATAGAAKLTTEAGAPPPAHAWVLVGDLVPPVGQPLATAKLTPLSQGFPA